MPAHGIKRFFQPALFAKISATMLCASSCSRHEQPPQTEVPRDPVVEMGRTGFEPKTFLCDLSGGPAGARNAMDGRRYTVAERAAARKRIAAALTGFGLTPKEHAYVVRDGPCTAAVRAGYDQPCAGTNLFAELPSTASNAPWIVVGAHYDTVRTSPGADDDASGTTAVLMVAEALSGMTQRRMNVLFVFFDQEEEGLFGSAAFVERLKRERRVVIAMHAVDMLGWDGNGNRAVEIGHGGNRREWGNFETLYGNAVTNLPELMPIRHTDMGRSDHEPFIAAGIPAVLVSEEFQNRDSTPNYHWPGDTCDTLDFAFHRMAATLVATAVALQIK